VRLDGLVAEASLTDLGLLRSVTGDLHTDVGSVAMDSRQVRTGSLFACVPGRRSDGHDFAATAVAHGAAALLCERELEVGVAQVVVSSVRRAIGPVCDAFFGHPSRGLIVAAVTGTNGKTTTCSFLDAIFAANGWPSTVVGTLTQQRTTPEAPDLQALLAGWRSAGGRAVAMEVSSHALAQHRTDAVAFDAAVFTNLTPEHLDYHRTMDEYFQAKARLFEPGRPGVAVVNRDDPWGRVLIERLSGGAAGVETFSAEDAHELRVVPGGATFEWAGHQVSISVGGRFNAVNAVAAAACARALGVDAATVAQGLSAAKPVRGRFELVDAGQSFPVIVDYAHTPDGLAKVLQAARELAQGRLIVVFGAGGDRDHEKRPLMGRVAADAADVAVLTSDNPRGEDPGRIIEQVQAGAAGRSNIVVEPDRASAIAAALTTARQGDVVVIAGKGHEQGQDIGGRILPFDDVGVARQALLQIQALRSEVR
jgi:UDP-N-acetylmuramoyl-L-alanyl-D-glutamate--2,6-diaminopimelate ligase